jgi:hypothetical protein
MPDYNIIGNDNSQPDGTIVGEAATSKVAFHGATPVIQRAGTTGSQDIIGAATYAVPDQTAANSGDAGTDTAIESIRDQLEALAVDVATHKDLANELRAALIATGQITGAD